MPLRQGANFAGYRVESILGSGGFGMVYRATHVRLQRTVALKVIRPGVHETNDMRARFQREAKLAASLEHANIVPIYDAGEHDDTLFISMKLIEGTTLAKKLDESRRLSIVDARRLLAQAALALDFAHARSIVHLDVKPENILVAGSSPGLADPNEIVYVSDFGLSKSLDSSASTSSQLAGTPYYMAPERFGRDKPAAAADIYALGCVAYQCVTGYPPFKHESIGQIIAAHMFEAVDLEPLRRAGLSNGAELAIARALEKSPSDRPRSATSFIESLMTATPRVTTTRREREKPAETEIATVRARPTRDRLESPPPARNRWLVAIVAGVLLIPLGAGTLYAANLNEKRTETTSASALLRANSGGRSI